ncbi:MAG: 1-acyl-sn-glycerol-3-phosphate acyltransferase [Candidatus Omnitrophica bacterium]|nr:1-acyl-sn-glycerol-3-phosphate acyltransferase [Candidatus Omnitrophota bacterium]MCM8816061.1 1-acyl-sn-glycerol-3-phosphate acyltransferase [Candidatus Omnitrophota bacterium]
MKKLLKEFAPGESNRILWMAAKILGFFVFKLFFHLEVVGKENMPSKGRFIIAANHASYLDPPLIGYICPRPIAYFTKQEQIKGFFGALIRRLGAIPVSRTSKTTSDIKSAISVLQKGKSLLIFPEGTRSRTGKFLPARPGIGFIIHKTGLPVLPIFIKGSFRAMPPGKNFIRPGKIIIKIGKLCYYHGQFTYQQIAQDVMNKIIEMSK